MPDRVLRTILSGKDELTGVLTKAAAETRAFENTVENAHVTAGRSATASAQAQMTASRTTVTAAQSAATAIVSARQKEQDAADKVRLAELRLNEAREKGKAKASTLLNLEGQLTRARRQHALALTDLGDAEDRANDEGERLGGRLSQGINQGLTRNAPVIVAAIAGALTAGAPLLLGAAVALFGVLGTVAAAQSDAVQSAWVGTWGVIRDEATSAARVLEPTLIGVAARVADRFEELGPSFARAFGDAAPLIDEFADSVLDATENALPGMFRAVERGQPVIEGLGNLLESIGTGLSDMFDAMSDHSDAAGQVFTELGDAMEQLLPLLGELLGQGAELAADVLPGLTGTLGLLLDVTRALGPTLPVIIAGFSAMRIGKSVAGGLSDLAEKLGKAATNGGAFAGVAGRLAPSVSGIASNAGIAGAAIGFMAVEAYAWTEAGRQAEDVAIRLGRAFQVGGGQADGASGFIQRFDGINRLMSTGIGETVGNIQFLGYSFADLIPDTEQATTSYNDWLRGLSRGDQATELVRVATEQLSTAVAEHGPASDEAATAVDNLRNAQAAAAAVADAEAMAIRGVTDAMIAQTDAVLAATNSEYAHRVAAEAADDAFKAMNDAIADHGRNSEEASDAALQFEGSLLRVVSAAGQMAEDALPATMDANERLALSQLAQLDALHALADQYGDALPGSLREMIAELERSTAGYDRAKLEADALAEGTKNAQSALEGLGSMNAEPSIDADDSGFKDKTAGALRGLKEIAGQHPTPVLDADDKMAKIKTAGAMASLMRLAQQRPTPVMLADDSNIRVKYANSMSAIANLARQRPTPTFAAIDHASPTVDQILAKIAAVQSRTVTITTNHVETYRTVGSPMVASTLADGGPIRAATGVKIVGRGGPRDDLVRAFVPGGPEYRVSPGEWIVNAAVSAMQGDRKMRALNAGQASIVLGGDGASAPTAMPGYGAGPGAWGGQGSALVQKRTEIAVDATGYNDRAIAAAIVKKQREDDFLRG